MKDMIYQSHRKPFRSFGSLSRQYRSLDCVYELVGNMPKRVLLFSRNTSTLHYSFYCDVGWSATIKRGNSEPDNLTLTMAYLCFRCGELFTQRTYRDYHVRDEICIRPLVERRRYQCRFCVSKFTRKDSQQRHEKTCKERHRFPCSYCDATFTTEGQRQRHEEAYCRVPPEPMEEEWVGDRFEKSQILQHNPEVWRGYVHASNGTSYGYWLSQDTRLCYLGLGYETMKKRLATIEECQRWMYV